MATQPATFERCRDGFYPSPASYPRTRESFDYMAFYRTAPVSSITHCARVADRVYQDGGGQGPMDEAAWTALIDLFSDEDRVVVFTLGELVPLDAPVENDANGARGAWYCTIADPFGAGRPSTDLTPVRDRPSR